MSLPTDYSGLVAWYRADSLTLSGSAVSAFLDKSGTGDPSKDATQANASLRPTYNSIDPLYNNQPTVSWTTNAQLLRTGAWATPLSQPATVILVGHSTLLASSGYAFDSFSPGSQFACNLGAGVVNTFTSSGNLNANAGGTNTPMIAFLFYSSTSSSISVDQVTPQATGNAGPGGTTGLTIGDYSGGGTFGFAGTIAEIIIYNRQLSSAETAALAGYLQQRYGIPVLGSTQSAVLVGPYLSDLRLAAQQRADRVNATTITTSEWNGYLNGSAQELWGRLTSIDPDYGVKNYDFTLAGGAPTSNTLSVGPNTNVSDFFKPRALWLNVNSSGQYVPIPRLESLMERHLYVYPSIVPVYGAIPSRWDLYNQTIEILPSTVAGNAYRLRYLPTLPKLVLDSDSIAQYWLSVNGWEEYIILDAAAKALIKEESLDTAQLLLQQKEAIGARIIREAQPRDVSQPRAITDMSRVRAPWGAWNSPGGMPGPGWGGDGGGCW